MKTIYKITYSLILLVLFSTVEVYSYNIDKNKYKKTKTINKEFSVSHDNTVNIINKYGDLTVTTWNENSVSIEVVITVKSDDEEHAQNKLNNITIDFNQEDNTVYAVTNIEKQKFYKWTFFGNKNTVSTKIDYHIKMPVANHVDLNNNYGSIYIDKLEGKCKINCDYGAIRIGELQNKFNEIYMDYGGSSTIEFINAGKINSDYSKLTIESANELNINADYSNIDVNNVDEVHYNNDFGSLELGTVKTVIGNGDYLTLKIDELIEKVDISCDFGSIKIYDLIKGFNTISVDASYTGVKIGVADDVAFNFNTSTSYAGIDFKDLNVDFNYKEIQMASKSFKGYVNSENSNSFIHIDSEFGNIKVYKKD